MGSMMTHTAGPWERQGLVVSDAHGNIICVGRYDAAIDMKTARANVVLIAAAPEMLELLRDLADAVDNDTGHDARELIARIEGAN